jgi:hypothetical protein
MLYQHTCGWMAVDGEINGLGVSELADLVFVKLHYC